MTKKQKQRKIPYWRFIDALESKLTTNLSFDGKIFGIPVAFDLTKNPGWSSIHFDYDSLSHRDSPFEFGAGEGIAEAAATDGEVKFLVSWYDDDEDVWREDWHNSDGSFY